MAQRLSGRSLRRIALATVGAVFAVVVPAAAAMAPAHGAPSYRLTLTPETPGRVYVARLDRSVDGGRSWRGAGDQRLAFAFVGEGAVAAISGSRASGGMTCQTSGAGTCTVTVDSPGDSSLTVVYEKLTATAAV
jgi:hypothetical protein